MDELKSTAADRRALARAVELAARGVGAVEPNPPVGAVLYRGDEILAEGWHREYGEAHAEVEALSDWGAEVPSDASLAVTLEPCSSSGKTPPCTQALLAGGVRRIVVGAVDPDPRHLGEGLDRLRAAGVEVCVDESKGGAAADLLTEFRRHLTLPRPFVLLKWAAGLDGCWAPRTGREWISSEPARTRVQRLRGHVDAIMVGSETALRDDPLLTARAGGPLRPLRVVLDARGRLPSTSRLRQTAAQAPLLWVTRPGVDAPPAPTEHWPLVDPHDVPAVLRGLYQRGVRRLLLEGGPTLAAAFLRADCVDAIHAYVAASWFSGAAAGGPGLAQVDTGPHAAGRFEIAGVEAVGCDALFRLRWRV